MKTIKNSCSIIIWILLIVLSNILLSNSAHGMGEYRIAAWQYVQSLFTHSALFWTVGILLLAQVILLNLKSFKYKNILIVCMTVIIIIISVMFYKDATKIVISYNSIIQDTDGVPEIGTNVLSYCKYILMYAVASGILSIENCIIGIKESVKNRG